MAKQRAGSFSNRNAFPTTLEPRHLRSGRQDGQVLVKLYCWWGPGSSLHPHMEEGLRGLLGVLFYESTNSIHEVSTLMTSSPPQGPPPHTITSGVRFQHVSLPGRHQHPAQNNHKLYGSIYKKYSEQANPETGSW